MKVFTTVLFIGTFLVFIGIPDESLARPDELLDSPKPHEVWNSCGTWCADTCDYRQGPGDICIAMCKRGYFCEAGYIRDTKSGNCVLPSECPPRT